MENLEHYLEAALADSMEKLKSIKPEIDAVVKKRDGGLEMQLLDGFGRINLGDSEKLHPRHSTDIPRDTFEIGMRLFDELKAKFGDQFMIQTLRLTSGFIIIVTPK